MGYEITERFRLTNYTKFFLKHYGFATFFRGVFLAYFYKKMRASLVDTSKEKTIIIHGDCKFVTKPNDKGISTELIMYKNHEPLCTKLVSRIIKEGMICIDLGSNIGYYAVLESKKVGKNGRVYAIEASPDNFNCLQKNCKLQNFTNLESYNFAGSEKNGEVNFITKTISNWSRVMREGEEPDPSDIVTKVPAKTIDTFVQESGIKKFDFFRMDVEGYEYNIYKGMKESIKKFKPILLIEFHAIKLGENLKKFLIELQNDGYESQNYIPRPIDNQYLANEKFVKHFTISEIIEKFEKKLLPIGFTLLLKTEKDKSSETIQR